MFERLNVTCNKVTFTLMISAVMTTVATAVMISTVTFNSSHTKTAHNQVRKTKTLLGDKK